MKIEIGDYVRTKDGVIDKLIIDYKGTCNNPNCNCKHLSCVHNYYDEDDILKVSHNIIDLIKIGDYVNGFKVTGLDYQYTTKVHKLSCNNEYGQEGILIIPSEIRNVVTKEQKRSR